MPTILVQYPQYFSNITRDDFLDNKNSGYYTIWQTLRDCAKVCTSSGTNAVWDISDSSFEFATTSRIEDTGTTQAVFHKYLTVHMPCFVAYGIAKNTEDYIEAVYRWSTGAVELFWATIFSYQFKHFVIVLLYTLAFSISCFSPSGYAVLVWWTFVFVTGVYGYYEKSSGYRPFRALSVTSTIVLNSLYWISNLLSVIWVILVPMSVSIWSNGPLSGTSAQSLFWAFLSLGIRLPIGIVTDRIITIGRFISPKTITDNWNFNLVLWRSSQLFVCSSAYTLLSLISGTRTAFRAWMYAGDNTFWTSFKFDEHNKLINKTKSDLAGIMDSQGIGFNYLLHVYILLRLRFIKFLNAVQTPDFLTKYLAAILFVLNIFCVCVSITVTNINDPLYLVTSLIIGLLNIFLVVDIALLLMPGLASVLGRPIRLEYMFAIFSIAVFISFLLAGNLETFTYYYNVL